MRTGILFLKKITHFTFAFIVLSGLLSGSSIFFFAVPAKTPQESKAVKTASPSAQMARRSSAKSKKTKAKNPGNRSRSTMRGQREIESSRVIEIQDALAAAGYYKDQPSGKWDESTGQAMSAYQQANGFKVTGKPDALSLKKLGL